MARGLIVGLVNAAALVIGYPVRLLAFLAAVDNSGAPGAGR